MKQINSLLCASARFLVLTVFIFLVSCGSDDEMAPQKITFAVPELAIPMGQEVFFFVTDADGELLALEQAFRGIPTEIILPADAPKKFTLHKLIYANQTTYKSFTIQSFTNAQAGDYALAPIVVSEEVETEPHILQLSDVPYRYLPQGIGSGIYCCSFSGSAGNFTIRSAIPPAGAEKLVYYMTDMDDKTKVPRYKVYTNAQAGATENLSFNDMTLADKKILALGENASVSVNINIQNGSDAYYEFFTMDNTTSVPLYYPGNVFKAYDTRIEMRKGDSRYHYRTIGAIPTVMKKLPVTVNSFTADQDELVIDKDGSFDYLRTISSTEWTTDKTNYLDWYVYLNDETDKFVIPELPAELITRYPELAGASVNFDYLDIMERNDFAGYEEWLKVTLIPGTPASSPLTESLRLIVDFASESDRRNDRREKALEERHSGNP